MIAVGVDAHKHRHLLALDGLWPGARRERDRSNHVELPRADRRLARLDAERSSGSRAPAATAPGSVSICSLPASMSLRSSDRKRPSDARRSSIASTRNWRPRRYSATTGSQHHARPASRRTQCASRRLSLLCRQRRRVLDPLRPARDGSRGAREQIGRDDGDQLASGVLMLARPGAQLHSSDATVLRDCARLARQLDPQTGQLPAPAHSSCPEPHPALLDEPGLGPISAARSSGATRHASSGRVARCNGTAPRPPPPARRSAIGSPAAATAKPTTRSTRSRSLRSINDPSSAPTSNTISRRRARNEKQCECSNATSPAASTTSTHPAHLDTKEASK